MDRVLSRTVSALPMSVTWFLDRNEQEEREELVDFDSYDSGVGLSSYLRVLHNDIVVTIAGLTPPSLLQDLLQAGVIKYQNNPVFQRKMVELTTEQSEAYKKMGLA